MTTYRQAIDRAVERLAPAVMDVREARANVKLALMELKSWSAVDLAVKSSDEMTPYMSGKLDAIVTRLLSHEPLQYILGVADFYGMRFKVDPSVLIPRPETAQLVDIIVSDAGDRPDLSVLDLCTGSGCIAIALARNLPFSIVKAVDISPEALTIARENANSLRAKIDFVCADVLSLSPCPELEFDIIVSNPPYIPESDRDTMDRNVLDFEPCSALFVPDSDQLKFYTAIASYSLSALRPGGKLYFEINPDSAGTLVTNLTSEGWENVESIRDIHGRYRFIRASRPE